MDTNPESPQKIEQILPPSAGVSLGKKGKRGFLPFLSGEVAMYIHPQNNLYASTSILGGIRRVSKKGRTLSLFVSAGGLLTRHLIDSYGLENGEVQELGKTMNLSFLPGMGIGLGGNNGFIENKFIRPYLNLRAQVQMPYNHTVLIHPVVELGFFFHRRP